MTTDSNLHVYMYMYIHAHHIYYCSVVAGSDVVKPFFLSPYTVRSVYFIICPSHQVRHLSPSPPPSLSVGLSPSFSLSLSHTCINVDDMYSQLKNMVSALFQSRPPERGGTRNFIIGECGWLDGH